MRHLLPAATIAALVACGGSSDRDDFERDFADTWCERQEECALGEFEEKYRDMDDCRFEKEDDLDIPNWEDVSCEVDPEQAGDCIDWMRDAACADWEKDNVADACDRVFVDC